MCIIEFDDFGLGMMILLFDRRAFIYTYYIHHPSIYVYIVIFRYLFYIYFFEHFVLCVILNDFYSFHWIQIELNTINVYMK